MRATTHLHSRLLHRSFFVRLFAATAAAAQTTPPRLFHVILHFHLHLLISDFFPLAQMKWPAGAAFHFLFECHIFHSLLLHLIFFIARVASSTARRESAAESTLSRVSARAVEE